jgi:hypothetical protein
LFAGLEAHNESNIAAIALIAMQPLFTLAAQASGGAAIGTPSSFMPPYPDYGLPIHCPCLDWAAHTPLRRQGLAHAHRSHYSMDADRLDWTH